MLFVGLAKSITISNVFYHSLRYGIIKLQLDYYNIITAADIQVTQKLQYVTMIIMDFFLLCNIELG